MNINNLIKQKEKLKIEFEIEINNINEKINEKKEKLLKEFKKKYDNLLIICEKYNAMLLKYEHLTKYAIIKEIKPIRLDPIENIIEYFEFVFNDILRLFETYKSVFSISGFIQLSENIKNQLGKLLYIIENFIDVFYDYSFEKEDKSFIQNEKNTIEEKYFLLEKEIVNKIVELKSESERNKNINLIKNNISVSTNIPNNIVLGYYNIDDNIMMFKQDFKNYEGNILINTAKPSNNIFNNIILQYVDKIPETLLRTYFIGKFSMSFVGLLGKLKESIKNKKVISDFYSINDADNVFENLKSELDERASKFYFEGDFFNYNSNNENNKSPIIIVFINNIELLSGDVGDILKTLILEGQQYGIYFIVTQGNIEKEDCYYDKKPIDYNNDEFNFICLNYQNDLNFMYGENVVNFNILSDDFNLKLFLESLSNRKDNSQKAIEILDIVSDDVDHNSSNIIIPIGKSGANIQKVVFEVTSNKCFMIIAGATGSGKSEFLHTLILSAAYNYSPDEINFYLIDFKDGVEFGPYIKDLAIPHIKLISQRNTLEDSYAILKKIQNIQKERNAIFQKSSCKDIIEYNKKFSNNKMARLFVIIDEYQVMLDGEGRIAAKCEKLLIDIVKQVRTVGISLILSSQACSCGRDIFEQISNRIVFKSKGALDKMIPNLEYNSEEKLNSLPIGSAYFYDLESHSIFRSAYIPNGDINNPNSKQGFISMINNKYCDYETNIIVSNDDRPIFYDNNDESISDGVNFGISAFDNEKMLFDFEEEANSAFANYVMLGDTEKAISLVNSIANSAYIKEKQINFIITSISNHASDNLITNFIPSEVKFYKNCDESYSSIKELYDEMNSRKKLHSKGCEDCNNKIHVCCILNLDTEIVRNYTIDEETNEEEYDEDGLPVFNSYDSSSNTKEKSLEEMLKELYKVSYKYKIFLFIHAVHSKEIDEFFDYNCKPNLNYGFYLSKEAFNYYLEKTSYTTGKVELSNSNSVYVKGDDEIKFKQYSFKKE